MWSQTRYEVLRARFSLTGLASSVPAAGYMVVVWGTRGVTPHPPYISIPFESKGGQERDEVFTDMHDR